MNRICGIPTGDSYCFFCKEWVHHDQWPIHMFQERHHKIFFTKDTTNKALVWCELCKENYPKWLKFHHSISLGHIYKLEKDSEKYQKLVFARTGFLNLTESL